jgi:hypothetical protein
VRPGDRVEIVGQDHPWHGSIGVIIGSFAYPGLDWAVRLIDGPYPDHEVAVASSEVARLAPQREIDVAAGGSACRVCGCTDNDACEEGCYWVEADLCSSCAGERP